MFHLGNSIYSILLFGGESEQGDVSFLQKKENT